ncbi:hypothetical protein QFZ67_000365 [Streptomyces sp. V1I1]|nr:hypothetical protein [Streptomyces sp. V1I1]
MAAVSLSPTPMRAPAGTSTLPLGTTSARGLAPRLIVTQVCLPRTPVRGPRRPAPRRRLPPRLVGMWMWALRATTKRRPSRGITTRPTGLRRRRRRSPARNRRTRRCRTVCPALRRMPDSRRGSLTCTHMLTRIRWARSHRTMPSSLRTAWETPARQEVRRRLMSSLPAPAFPLLLQHMSPGAVPTTRERRPEPPRWQTRAPRRRRQPLSLFLRPPMPGRYRDPTTSWTVSALSESRQRRIRRQRRHYRTRSLPRRRRGRATGPDSRNRPLLRAVRGRRLDSASRPPPLPVTPGNWGTTLPGRGSEPPPSTSMEGAPTAP